MRLIDVSGAIENGMWTYPPPHRPVVIEEIGQAAQVQHETFAWRFELTSLTGTYAETSLHVDRNGPQLIEIPVEKLVWLDTAVLRVPCEPDHRIEPEELEACGVEINPGDAVIVATGWDSHWNQPDFITNCPWFSYAAMRWLLDREPFILAGDVPRYDSWDDPQGFWPELFGSGALVMGPLVNLDQVRADRVKMIALPLKVAETCAAPTRVVLVEE